MFENLREAFSNAAKSLGEKELKDKDIDEVLFQLEISLLESDVATEVIDAIKSDLKQKLIGTKVGRKEIEEFVKKSLVESISELFDAAGTIDIISNINAKKQTGKPYIILFVGINGTGKTTTLAKLAYLLQKSKFSVVVAAADTFRAGAIEQLKEHTNRLKLKLVAQNYGSDPAAVARDAVLHATSNKVDCVLVDTAGRMQTSKNLMDQIAKITNVVKPDFKIFVGDSLAGNDTVNQAKEFYEHTKFDASILTKSDADARGGAALSIVKVTSTPILYVGVGQEYEDLKPFDKNLFIETIFGKVVKSEESKPTLTKPQETHEEPVEEESISEEITPTHQTKETEELEIIEQSSDTDPFSGIDTKDINRYVELYDSPPPEDDKQAQELSIKIKKWISDGRPKPNEKQKGEEKMTDKEDVSKKRRSLFGRFKK